MAVIGTKFFWYKKKSVTDRRRQIREMNGKVARHWHATITLVLMSVFFIYGLWKKLEWKGANKG